MSVSKRTRFEIFKRDRFTCQYCGKRPPDVTLEVDHIVALAEGGGDEPANLTTACFACNRGKSAVPLGLVAPAVDELELLGAIQEMLERKGALRARLQASKALQETETALVDAVMGWLEDVHEELIQVAHRSSVVKFAHLLDPEELREAVNAAAALRDQLPSTSPWGLWKYFCGACWRIVKRKQEAEGTHG